MLDWDVLWKITLAVLASIGGISGLILMVIKFSSNIIADRLSKKYAMKLSKEMEAYKANIENKVYISKAKFDTEFQLYRELTAAFTKMVKECSQLFPKSTKDTRNDYEKYKNEHDKAVDSIIIAQDELYASAPFISEDLYNQFTEIQILCKNQLNDFQDFRLRPDAEDYRNECKEAYKETYKRTHKIDKKFNELISTVRKYMSSLDVME